MNADILLDAIGMVDDRFLAPEKHTVALSLRRKIAVAIAAVLIFAASIGTAMAVSEEFRALVFSIFNIETHEQPPAGNANTPSPVTDSTTEPDYTGLQEVDVVNIDGEVNAYYFETDGKIRIYGNGIYTSDPYELYDAPENFAFWEFSEEKMVPVEGRRVDFPFTYNGHTSRIRFDYAVMNGSVSVIVWHEPDEDDLCSCTYWRVTDIKGRTDVVLLCIPTLKDVDYSNAYYLLNLATLETTPLLKDTPLDDLWIYAAWFTPDWRYCLFSGWDGEDTDSYWLYDLEAKTVENIETLISGKVGRYTVYFMDGENIIVLKCKDDRQKGPFELIRYHIPSKTLITLEEIISPSTFHSVSRNDGIQQYGLLSHGGGSYELIDLYTNDRLPMSGLPDSWLSAEESPDGKQILLAFQNGNKYTSLGVLDLKTGVMKLMTREVRAESEYIQGWINSDTLVVTAWAPSSKCYVYAYSFRE